MKLSIQLLLILFCLLSSCKKSEHNSDMLIKAGFICGWGSGTDSLEISQTGIKYSYYIPSKSNLPIIVKTRSVSENEWVEILSDVDIDTFMRLNYQSCNVCFDGCDEWITIRNDHISHMIRFAKDLKIDSISGLQNKLTELRAEFNR
jgi:hypothetical protein